MRHALYEIRCRLAIRRAAHYAADYASRHAIAAAADAAAPPLPLRHARHSPRQFSDYCRHDALSYYASPPLPPPIFRRFSMPPLLITLLR